MIDKLLTDKTLEAFGALYNQEIDPRLITIQKTRREFEGDLTIVVFPVLKFSKKSPEQTADDLGNFLKEQLDEVSEGQVDWQKLLSDFYFPFMQQVADGKENIVSLKLAKPLGRTCPATPL
jgi:hypothetical protein